MEQENNVLLVHLLKKVDRVEANVSLTRESQVRMEADLKYHIRRTDLLEEEVKEIRWVRSVSRSCLAVLRFLRLIK